MNISEKENQSFTLIVMDPTRLCIWRKHTIMVLQVNMSSFFLNRFCFQKLKLFSRRSWALQWIFTLNRWKSMHLYSRFPQTSRWTLYLVPWQSLLPNHSWWISCCGDCLQRRNKFIWVGSLVLFRYVWYLAWTVKIIKQSPNKVSEIFPVCVWVFLKG